MTGLVTYDKNDDSVESLGHPSDCTEPAPGKVVGTGINNSLTEGGG